MIVTKRAATLILCATALALPGVASSAGKLPSTPRGVVAGKLTGLAAPQGLRVSSVRAVRLTDLAIVAGTPVGAPLRYKLRVPAGPYVVAADSADARSAYAGLSAPRTVKAGRTLKLDVPMRKTAAGMRAPAGRQSTTAGEYGKVVGVSPDVRVTSPDHPGGIPLDGMLITELVNDARCAKEISVVELRRRADILKELKLQRSDAVDPATRVQPKLLTPEYVVRGGGAINASGTFTVALRAVDVRTGKTVARASATGAASDFLDSVPGLSDRLAADLCKPKPPETTPAPAGQLTVTIRGTQTYVKSYRTSSVEFCENGSTGQATTTIKRVKTVRFATPRPYEAALLDGGGTPIGILTKQIYFAATVTESWSHVETFCGVSRTYDTPSCGTASPKLNGNLVPTSGMVPGASVAKLALIGGGGAGNCRADIGLEGADVAVNLARLEKRGTVTAVGKATDDRGTPPSGTVLENIERTTMEWQITFTRH